MSQYFKPYLYFNGEEECPFDRYSETDPSAQFWDYENHFEVMFGNGDLSFDTWKHIANTAGAKAELKDVLSENPVNKEELFKLFMFHILMEHLPDKAEQPPSDKYLKLYHKIK